LFKYVVRNRVYLHVISVTSLNVRTVFENVLRMPMSECDPLTGLLNYHQCMEYFQILSGGQSSFGIVLLDIDRFALFNAEYGHQLGDEKLDQVAISIRQTVSLSTRVFRVGGDEFLLFVTGCLMSEVVTCALQVKEAADQAFSTVPKQKSSYCFPDRSYLWMESEPSVSCGIAFYPHHGSSLELLIEAACRAMYLGGKGLRSGGVMVVAEFAEPSYL
jgi:diguanylate cyclase (GGDEF)-like protein